MLAMPALCDGCSLRRFFLKATTFSRGRVFDNLGVTTAPAISGAPVFGLSPPSRGRLELERGRRRRRAFDRQDVILGTRYCFPPLRITANIAKFLRFPPAAAPLSASPRRPGQYTYAPARSSEPGGGTVTVWVDLVARVINLNRIGVHCSVDW